MLYSNYDPYREEKIAIRKAGARALVDGAFRRRLLKKSGVILQPTMIEKEFVEIINLDDNWDGEGAPKPSLKSVIDTALFIDKLQEESLYQFVTDIGADVLGGTDLYLASQDCTKDVWVLFLNDNIKVKACFNFEHKHTHSAYGADIIPMLKDFFR